MNHRLFYFLQGLIIVMMELLCVGSLDAVGLGKIKIYSYLNEPLDAEIELLAAQNVVDSLLVSVASTDEFERAGVTRIPLLDKLMFQIIRDEDEIFIHATSKTLVTDPYVDFLLNLSWGPGPSSGRLIRRYTLLLDPVPPEGKPVYAKRRLMPNIVEQPKSGNQKKIRYQSVTDLAASALDEATTEKDLLLTESQIPALVVARTPQEKLANLSKQAKTGTNPSSSGVTETSTSPQRAQMHTLFDNHDKPVDLKSVVEDVERIFVSNRATEANNWFSESEVTQANTTATSAEPATAAVVEQEKKSDTPLKVAEQPKPVSSTEKTVQPVSPAEATPAPATPPVPVVVPADEKKGGLTEYLNLIITLGITVVLTFVMLWRRWKKRRQFAETRERLANLSRQAIDEERASAVTVEKTAASDTPSHPTDTVASPQQTVSSPQETEVTTGQYGDIPIVEEPFNMADLDIVLADENTAEISIPEAPAPAPAPIEVTIPTPVVEEINIDLDVPPPVATTPSVSTQAPLVSPVADPEEINLKLQLARQYVELGDFGGAKELLTVINAQGNAEQRKEAQELLEKII